MDRYLLTAAIIALCLEVAVLLADLQIIPAPAFFHTASKTPHERVIGRVEMVRQNVRRRGQDSLAWDSSEANDVLYDYDSVLTLKQSAAQLDLEHDIHIHLDENTLVVLEPIGTDKDSSSIRLRFTEGAMSVQNPKSPLQMKAHEWSMQVKADSQIHIRTLQKGKIQVEVNKGQVVLTKGKNAQTLKENSLATVDPNSVASVQHIEHDLQWTLKKDQRVYSHQFPVAYKVSWQGAAKNLQILNPDKSQVFKTLQPGQHDLELPFQVGTYILTLQDSQGLSPSLAIHVWQAPIIRYYSPLPRDRVRTHDALVFSWTPVELATQYHLQMSTSPDFASLSTDIASEKPKIKVEMNQEGDRYWRVNGVDDQGFEIPAYYVNPLYSVEQPLPPPVLEQPDLIRRPAGVESNKPRHRRRRRHHVSSAFDSLIDLFVTPAQAQQQKPESDDFEAVFQWLPVAGADHYVIEICSTPDFQNPIVMDQVKDPVYHWLHMTPGKYYWRVAAGRGTERGLFSEVASADLTHVNDSSNAAIPKLIRHVVSHKTKSAVVHPPAPRPQVSAVASKPAPITQKQFTLPVPEPLHARLWLGESYMLESFSAPQSVNGSLIGSGPWTAELDLSRKTASQNEWEAAISAESISWKSKTSDNNPFQNTLTEEDINAAFFYGPESRKWHWGGSVQKTSTVERKDLEIVGLKDQYLLGPAMVFQTTIGAKNLFEFEPRLQVGSGLWGLAVRARATHLWRDRFLTGVQFESSILQGTAQTWRNDLSLWLGLSW